MTGKILIPVDGSANSFNALDYGIYIAKKLDAVITGLYVLDANLIQGPVLTDISGSVGMPPYDGFFEAIETSLNEKADFILKDFQQRCRQSGLSAQTKKIIGKIGPAIIEEGRETDLIIMAKKGEHFHLRGGGLLGSVAEAVVRNSGKPVIVTPENYLEIESMAVAYDGSEPAKKALRFSLRLANKTAWPLTTIIISADEQKTAALSGEVESMLEDQTIDADVIIMQGKEKEAEEIIKYIKEGAVELLAMGAFGHNRLRALLMGSTTSQVIQKSSVPVLLTR